MDANYEIRQQIETALLSYTRGVDRLDGDAIAAAFHPDAELDGYGPKPRTVSAFIEKGIPSLRVAYRATQHRITNIRIEMRGEVAAVETYVVADHITASPDGPERLLTFNGRYVDRFDERAGTWRIALRSLRTDWTRITELGPPMPGTWVAGSRDRDDSIYAD